ncbi:MAG TPA: hypothetical protein VF187_08825, partial [Gemmatimonadales bacterium]
ADSATLAERGARFDQTLARADSTRSPDSALARWMLPPALKEISGLALTEDGRLFAHNDESGLVSEIDYRRGAVVKRFWVGGRQMRADFEALTVANGSFFMMASNGKLYEFREGEDGKQVDYTLHDTHLGRECEFEGVAFDSASNALLLACKNVTTKKLRDFLVIYRWALDDTVSTRLSTLTIPMATVIGSNKWKHLQPTDITVDPSSGNYVMVAAPQKALIEITPAGAVVFARSLPGRHAQAEGVAITRDGVLIVSDEALRLPASITLYRWP